MIHFIAREIAPGVYALGCGGQVRLGRTGHQPTTKVDDGRGGGPPCATCAAWEEEMRTGITSGQAHGGIRQDAHGGFNAEPGQPRSDEFIGGLEDDVVIGTENDPYPG